MQNRQTDANNIIDEEKSITYTYFPFEPDANPELVEAVFDIPRQQETDSKKQEGIEHRKSATFVIQTKYFKLPKITPPVENIEAYKAYVDLFNNFERYVIGLKTFKYLYFLRMTDLEFNCVYQTLKKPDATHPQLTAVVIDDISFDSVKLFLEVIPSSVKKIGLHKVSADAVNAFKSHIKKNNLLIAVVLSDELKAEMKKEKRDAKLKSSAEDIVRSNTTLLPGLSAAAMMANSSQEDHAIKLSDPSPPRPPRSLKRSKSLEDNIQDLEQPEPKRASSGPESSKQTDGSSNSHIAAPESHADFLSSPRIHPFGIFSSSLSPLLSSLPSSYDWEDHTFHL